MDQGRTEGVNAQTQAVGSALRARGGSVASFHGEPDPSDRQNPFRSQAPDNRMKLQPPPRAMRFRPASAVTGRGNETRRPSRVPPGMQDGKDHLPDASDASATGPPQVHPASGRRAPLVAG